MGIDAEMVFRFRPGLEAPVLRTLSFDLAEAFGPDHLLIQRDELLIELCDSESLPDGPDWTAGQWFSLSIFGRYYGRGYERGPIVAWIAIAEWIEHRLPASEVWYGGETDDLELFNRSARDALFRYFCEVGHKPALQGSSRTSKPGA